MCAGDRRDERCVSDSIREHVDIKPWLSDSGLRETRELPESRNQNGAGMEHQTPWFPWKLPETQSAGDPLVSLWVAGNSRAGFTPHAAGFTPHATGFTPHAAELEAPSSVPPSPWSTWSAVGSGAVRSPSTAQTEGPT